jgi:hypothetical protein
MVTENEKNIKLIIDYNVASFPSPSGAGIA